MKSDPESDSTTRRRATDPVTAVDPSPFASTTVSRAAEDARKEDESDDEETVRRSLAEVAQEHARRRASAGDKTTVKAPEPPRTVKHTPEWSTVVPERTAADQRKEARLLVPNVQAMTPDRLSLPEASEDGLMPSGELDRKLADMDVLLRYGHFAQAEAELNALRAAYPQDLLLLRRIAELYVTRHQTAAALDVLFSLAQALFERRNFEGTRQALEQVQLLDHENVRAKRLLGLLDKRPATAPTAPNAQPSRG